MIRRPPLRFQYMSDLHLERIKSFPRIRPTARHLALLGDIGHPHTQNYRDFLSYCSHSYERTYLLAGNHEYYGGKVHEVQHNINRICDPLGNVFFLQQRASENDGITIAGCTLWSNISEKTTPVLNDFRSIFTDQGLLTHQDYLRIHQHDVNWLTSVITTAKQPLIVLTHHLPSYRIIGKRYAKHKHQDAFATSLDYLIKGPHLQAWLCGHSHDNIEGTINGVYYGINSGQYIDFDRYIVV